MWLVFGLRVESSCDWTEPSLTCCMTLELMIWFPYCDMCLEDGG